MQPYIPLNSTSLFAVCGGHFALKLITDNLHHFGAFGKCRVAGEGRKLQEAIKGTH